MEFSLIHTGVVGRLCLNNFGSTLRLLLQTRAGVWGFLCSVQWSLQWWDLLCLCLLPNQSNPPVFCLLRPISAPIAMNPSSGSCTRQNLEDEEGEAIKQELAEHCNGPILRMYQTKAWRWRTWSKQASTWDIDAFCKGFCFSFLSLPVSSFRALQAWWQGWYLALHHHQCSRLWFCGLDLHSAAPLLPPQMPLTWWPARCFKD